jgi:hypothetical protein
MPMPARASAPGSGTMIAPVTANWLLWLIAAQTVFVVVSTPKAPSELAAVAEPLVDAT